MLKPVTLLSLAALTLTACASVETQEPAAAPDVVTAEAEATMHTGADAASEALDEALDEAVAEATAEVAESAPAGREPMDMAAIMEAYKAYGTPGEEHKSLAAIAGEWVSESKMWMSPDQPEPTLNTGKVTRRMIMGGRYLMEEHSGQIMGQPFEGMLILGFNNLDKKYHSVWLDSMGTGFSLSSGQENADGALEMSGIMQDPITPNGRKYRGTLRAGENADTQIMDMYDTLPDGTEWKVMEVTYRRVKK